MAATTIATDTTPSVPSVSPQTTPTNTRVWETIQSGGKKPKAPTPKLIPTKYPQAEREVTCHFHSVNADNTNGIQPDKSYTERQAITDVALHRVNVVLVNNKDVLASPFI